MVQERRQSPGTDRRRHPRGGRRATDVFGRHPRVVIADTYEPALRPCSLYLEHFNFDVGAVVDGQALAAEIGRRPPAIVLMGASLKNPSSKELLDRAARDRGIPVILFADSLEQSTSPEFAELSGAAAVLVKPFTLGGMLETIRTVLRAQARLG
jgi:DNA-binding response OmpR family regulator